MDNSTHAPGKPGIPARWTSSAKDGIGKALNASSNVSFTISHGILNEIYYPREDTACTRDMEFIVTDGKEFFSEEKRNTSHETKMVEKGIPVYEITNNCFEGRYSIEKEIVSDPIRNVVLQRVRFKAWKGEKEEYKLFALLAPHLGNSGGGNISWVDEYKGVPMLFAFRQGIALAFACSYPWKKRSAGFVGQSDGWRDLHKNKQMTVEYKYAKDGNVALTGEINLEEAEDTFIVAIGFGRDKEEAGIHVLASMIDGFDVAKEFYIKEWKDWQKKITHRMTKDGAGELFRESASVLRMHEAKRFPGAIVASMSIPWGDYKGDYDIGGYHLVWARDLVETSGGLLAMGAKVDTQRILNYLTATQEASGLWPQNMWLSGKPHWKGIQMDEVALPVLLIDLCKSKGILDSDVIKSYWTAVEKAIGYLVREGPYTQQDRWEEEAGYSTFTIATEIAALLSASDFAQKSGKADLAEYCCEIADSWNESIEDWCYVTGTELAEEAGVEGYYIHINPCRNIPAQELGDRQIHIRNHPQDKGWRKVTEVVSTDPLALVRFGLRAPDDPRILNTIKVIDKLLKVDTPGGPCWHRYNYDGYGENADGSGYDGTGIGRAWPLLTGERAHYEIAAGDFKKAKALVKTMESFSNHGLLPEQIWDTKDIPEKELFFGKHSGSAMPLVWAQAEYIKLCASVKQKKVFDMPEHPRKRYIDKETRSKFTLWSFETPCKVLEKGKKLRIQTKASALVHLSTDNWQTIKDLETKDTGLGVYYVDLPKATKKEIIRFTFYWKEADKWEDRNFNVEVA